MSNNNATVALPDNPNWAVWWSPQSGFGNFQLDIVGFLAVLGENAVLANAQVASLSRVFYLPRLLPAPQALLRIARPTSLPAGRSAKVTGVLSGNVRDYVQHVADALLDEDMPKFSVRCVEVNKSAIRKPNRIDMIFRGQPKQNVTDEQVQSSPTVRGKATGPLFWVTMIGFLEVVILFTCSIIFGDGMSILATIFLSGLSTVVGIINKSTLTLPRRGTSEAPRGDVVIRYRNGSFLIVKCVEDIARELFFAPEEIEYNITSPAIYILLSLLGTVMLMLGIVALANAKLQLQIGWAGAFIIINIAHWVAAALPPETHWDLSCYQVKPQKMKGRPLPENSNFTNALWKAILLSESTAWVRPGDAAPSTPVWDAWLDMAEEKAIEAKTAGYQEWDAKAAWDNLNKRMNGKPALLPRQTV